MNTSRIDPALPQPYGRALRDESDVRRIRDLLLETHSITPVDWNWEVRRWDGWRYHRSDLAWDPLWEKTVRLWATANGRLVAAVHPEGSGNAHLQLHPDYRAVVEEEMVAWAETHLALAQPGGTRKLELFVFDYDSPRQRLLAERGYERLAGGGVTRRLRLGERPLPTPDIASGYHIRTTRPGAQEDYQGVAAILNAAFQRNIHTAVELRNFMTHSPSFRHDLDLLAAAPDGSFAAYVGVTYDGRNRLGIFEPVCTHPDHRRRGLARALMVEGLWRLRDLGASEVTVGTGDDVAANRLYEAVGFTEAYRGRVWEKRFEQRREEK